MKKKKKKFTDLNFLNFLNQYMHFPKSKLKDLCKHNNISTSGNLLDLQSRIFAWEKENKKFVVEFDEEKMNNIEELIKWISDKVKKWTTQQLQRFVNFHRKFEERKKFGDGRKTDTNIKFLCFWFRSEEGKEYLKKILKRTKEHKKQVLLKEEKKMKNNIEILRVTRI